MTYLDQHDIDRHNATISMTQMLIDLCREVREKQSAFLSSIGMTWEEARALDAKGKAELQRRWSDYRRLNP